MLGFSEVFSPNGGLALASDILQNILKTLRGTPGSCRTCDLRIRSPLHKIG